MTALSEAIADVLAYRTILYPHTIHLWRFALDGTSELGRLRELLSPDERARAQGFAFDTHRARFIAGRGWLRLILGAYSGVGAERLELAGGPGGKPCLGGRLGATRLRFNFSGSEDLGIVAVGHGREVGVDVERIKPIERLDDLVAHSLSRSERAVYEALPANRKLMAFYTVWTRKEAYMKATGRGLRLPLAGLDVSLETGNGVGTGNGTVPLSVQDDADEGSRWSLRDVACGLEYTGAVCAEGREWGLIYVV